MELSSSFRPQPGAPWRGLRVLGARLRTERRQTWPAFLKTADERKPCARRGAGPVPASGCGTEGGPCAGRGLARLRDRRGTVCRAGPGWASERCGSGGRRGSDLWPPWAGGGATSSTVTRGQHGRQRAWGPWHSRTVLSGQGRSSQNYRSCDSLSWLQGRQGPVVRAGLPVTERRAGPGAVGLLLGPPRPGHRRGPAPRTLAFPCSSGTVQPIGVSLAAGTLSAPPSCPAPATSCCTKPRASNALSLPAVHTTDAGDKPAPASAPSRLAAPRHRTPFLGRVAELNDRHAVPRSCGPEGSPGGVCVPAATSLHRRVHG